ncbi:MAG: hypothetical protein P8X47_13445 [Ignavibacteriaceae bacterium]
MIVASIDIGTNTVLLLIAEVQTSGKIIPLFNEYRMPRIGKGTEQNGSITQEKINLLIDVLKEYDELIKKYKCEKVLVSGTNIKDVEEPLVIDIGGGSTELIFGNKSEILSKKSLPIGSVSATEKFLKDSPPSQKEIDSLKKKLNELLKQITYVKKPTNVIAIAGTATTLSCMNLGLKEFEEDKVEMSTITMEEINKIIEKLTGLTSSKILENYGPVLKGREDIILAGAIILSEIMNLFSIKNVIVSSRGIRYGAIVNYLNNFPEKIFKK